MPVGVSAVALAVDDDVDEEGLAGSRDLDAAADRGPQVGGRLDGDAVDALAPREAGEVDVWIAEVHAGVAVGRLHLAVVAGVGEAYGLVVPVVRHHGEHRHAVAGLRPEAGGAVHHRAVADAADDLPVRLAELGAGRGADAPAEAGAGGREPGLLVVTVAGGEELVRAAEVLADDDRIGVEFRLEHVAQLVGVDRTPADVRRVELWLPASGVGPGSADLRSSLLRGERFDRLDQGLGGELRVRDDRASERPVAADRARVQADPGALRALGIRAGGGRAADVADADAEHKVAIPAAVAAGVERVHARETVERPVHVGHLYLEKLGQFQDRLLGAGLADLVADVEDGCLGLDQHPCHRLDVLVARRNVVRDDEGRAVVDRGAHSLGLQSVVGQSEVGRTAGRRRRHLVGAAQHHRDRAGVTGLPGHLRELPVHVLLVEAGPGPQQQVVVLHLVVEQAGGHDQGGAVPARVVELAGGLGGAGDHVDVDEGRFTGGLVVAVGHRDNDALVQSHDELHAGPVQECVEETDFERAGVREQEAGAGRGHLLDHQLAAGTGCGAAAGVRIGVRRGGGRVGRGLGDRAGETKRRQGLDEAAAGEIVAEEAVDQFVHGEPPMSSWMSSCQRNSRALRRSATRNAFRCYDRAPNETATAPQAATRAMESKCPEPARSPARSRSAAITSPTRTT